MQNASLLAIASNHFEFKKICRNGFRAASIKIVLIGINDILGHDPERVDEGLFAGRGIDLRFVCATHAMDFFNLRP